MKRNVSLSEISDGKLYGENDMVRADCHGCNGCSACCRGMGASIILDPYDVFRLTSGLGKSLQELIAEDYIELHVVDGVILPNLHMAGEREQCAFLNREGRCSIHELRPGICRLFPLGRYYENGDFRYFLQVGECDAPHSKIKVSKWIDTPNLQRNHAFVVKWHYLLNKVEEFVMAEFMEKHATYEGADKQINMLLLQMFYLKPYASERDFYEQVEERIALFYQAFQS
ncbi:MAG: YkgJ family cysteine cluster protein [Lachnospiraceae bacterium]|nr:YkgJ family cysteine cluster protein [Lachnospiraceae bacterium]